MNGEVLPYIGKTENFYVIDPPSFYPFRDRDGKYSNSFKDVACDGALLETINILNYGFLFSQLFNDLFSSLHNQTNFLGISQNIRKYQSIFSDMRIEAPFKANSSLMNPSKQWNRIKSLFKKGNSSYQQITKPATKSMLPLGPWLFINEIENLTHGFNILHRNHSITKLYNSLHDLFQWSNRSQSEPNYTTNYFKRMRSSFKRLLVAFTNASTGRNKSYIKNNFDTLDMTNDTESMSDEQMSHNKPFSMYGMFGWMKKRAKQQSDKFMQYFKKFSSVSLAIL